MTQRWLAVVALVGCLGGCSGKPERPLQIQGTVTSIGYDRPVPNAEVIVEWPPSLGGGSVTVKTDRKGHYVLGRTVRADSLDCTGTVITVRASGFASAYNQSSGNCSAGLLSEDFKLFPTPG